ncbi:MAG: gliding motility-associated C-terminal domain-containing protein [Fluviicola sp.]
MKNYFFLIVFLNFSILFSQNGIVGDGFGGRLWYHPTNYVVGSYSAFVTCENQLYGWGCNENGELGQDPLVLYGSESPIQIPNMNDVKYFTSGYVCGAIKLDNSGWVSGFYNLNYEPTQVRSDVKFVDASQGYLSFIKNNGTVWSLGENFGTFGNNSFTSSFESPLQMNGINNAVRIASSTYTNYVLTEDGNVYVAGKNFSGNPLGTSDTSISEALTPLLMHNLENIIDIKAVSSSLIALNESGEVFWFNNLDDSIPYPHKIEALSNIVAVSGVCDGEEFLVLDESKNVYSFIDGITSSIVATDVIDILAGETFSYLVKSDGTLWCRGSSLIGSVWLNLSNETRLNYTLIDYNEFPEICAPILNHVEIIDCETIQVFMNDEMSPYVYNIGNGNQSSPIFTEMNPGNYIISVVNGVGDTTVFNITLPANIENVNSDFLSSDSSQLILVGSSLNFVDLSSESSNIYWNINNNYISSDSLLTYSFQEEGIYCVELIAENNNCTDSSEICFQVYDNQIFFPNVFTPNGDGDNDVFKINLTGTVNYNATIVNRWGNKVAELSNSFPTWNGKVDGVEAVDGVYFITVDYSVLGLEPQKYSGFFHLQR